MEKGEIAHFEQFHLFQQCFPEAFFFNVLKLVFMKERLKQKCFVDAIILNICHTIQFLTISKGKSENIVEKGENAGYQHFLPFSTMFLLPYHIQKKKRSLRTF